MYKFKVFFVSSFGVPPEKEINNWLKSNRNIEIRHVRCDGNSVYIFYKDMV